MENADRSSLANLIAEYGCSTSTVWLESERFDVWQPSDPILGSSFTPVQGYMLTNTYIFAWGNPLVSSPLSISYVVRQFISFAESQQKHLIWLCVDNDLEHVLGEEYGWSTLSCIYEDFVDPARIIELTSHAAKGKEGQRTIKDLKKNLAHAGKARIVVNEVRNIDISRVQTLEIDQGIKDWKSHKNGLQIAASSLNPWLDMEHRRYWLAQTDQRVNVDIFSSCTSTLITSVEDRWCSRLDPNQLWMVANQECDLLPFRSKRNFRGLAIHKLQDLHNEMLTTGIDLTISPYRCSSPTLVLSTTTNPLSLNSSSSSGGSSNPESLRGSVESSVSSSLTSKWQMFEGPRVTFGIRASSKLEPVHNLNGWKVSALSAIYAKIAGAAGLVKKGEFRSKFDSEHIPLYICYPDDGFGLDGVNALLKALRK